MNFEPTFLSVEEVTFLHDEQLARFGGAAGIRDMGLLESAVGMPQASFGGEFLHEDLFSMAAAYAFHIAQNQAFAMIDVAERALNKYGLAELLRRLGSTE